MQTQTTINGAGPEVSERDRIILALHRWIAQRPGLDFRDYGDATSYRAECRSIARDKREAEALLRYVELFQSIDADRLKEAFSAFSGRLSWDGQRLDYCTGQYWPTEYRRAACAVLASAIWYWWRDAARHGDGALLGLSRRECLEAEVSRVSIGDILHRKARAEFGQAVARRWFN